MTEPRDQLFAYDAVAYPTPIVPEMSPSRIRAAGAFYGYRLPPVDSGAVLEIGCGDGFNLLAIAAASPSVRHIGFDLSAAAIERGRKILNASGLENADLEVGDIATWRHPELKFDYILCHGVHSWVPFPVQQKLLELIADQLAPGGVAYLSHDVLPAAAPKQAIKAFLKQAISPERPPAEAIVLARELLTELAANQLPQSRLKPQLDILGREMPSFDDGYFFHDWLSEAYAPVAMVDLAESAARFGLMPIADAALVDLFDSGSSNATGRVAEMLGGDYSARAQANDMLSGTRMFRRTILALASSPPPLEPAWHEMSFSLAASPEAGGAAYRGPDNALFRPASAVQIKVMSLLERRAPREVSFLELLKETGDELALKSALTQICSVPAANAYASPPPYVENPGERPLASPLARVMLSGSDIAPTLRLNRLVSRQGTTRSFLGLCDGTRTRADLRREMSIQLGRDVPAHQIDAVLDDLAARQVFIS